MKIARVSSSLKAVELRQLPAPLIIGERLNTQGSKKAKQLVLSDDFDGLIDLARIQVEDGAHCLDVCVATTERSDELEFMKKLVKRLSLEIDAPLVIDSTDPIVIETAIHQIPGRPMINSISAIRAGKILGIRAGTGTHRIIGIWAVVVEGRVFVRSWSLSPGGWYDTLTREKRGTIRIGSRRLPVRAVHTRSERLKKAVSAAYRANTTRRARCSTSGA